MSTVCRRKSQTCCLMLLDVREKTTFITPSKPVNNYTGPPATVLCCMSKTRFSMCLSWLSYKQMFVKPGPAWEYTEETKYIQNIDICQSSNKESNDCWGSSHEELLNLHCLLRKQYAMRENTKHSRSFRTCFKILNLFLLWTKILGQHFSLYFSPFVGQLGTSAGS